LHRLRTNGLPLLNHQSCKNTTAANQPIDIPLETKVKVGFFRECQRGGDRVSLLVLFSFTEILKEKRTPRVRSSGKNRRGNNIFT